MPSGAVTPEALADQFIAALNAQDEASLRKLATGHEDLAEVLRDAALTEPDLPHRLDLSPQQRLTVLALRDHYDRAALTQLDAWSLVTARPDPDAPFLDVPAGQQVYFTGLRSEADGQYRQWWLDSYFGLQPQRFPLELRSKGWFINLAPLFDPDPLGPSDLALAEQVLAAGGDAQAWLEAYAQHTNQPPNPDILQIP